MAGNRHKIPADKSGTKSMRNQCLQYSQIPISRSGVSRSGSDSVNGSEQFRQRAWVGISTARSKRRMSSFAKRDGAVSNAINDRQGNKALERVFSYIAVKLD